MELFEAAKKAADAAASVDGGAEESRCLDALQQLKNFPVTYQVLVSSQVLFFFSYYIIIFLYKYFLFFFWVGGGFVTNYCKTNGILDMDFFFLLYGAR